MDNRPILLLDSGIGGLPYGDFFHRHNRAEALVYVADRARFPYGKREREELIEGLCSLMETLIACFNPKLAVLACNTASVSALDSLRQRFPGLPWVGTVPAVKPAVLGSRKRHVAVLGTERTIDDPYIQSLADRYGNDCRISGIAAPELVEFVEYRCLQASPAERLDAVEPYVGLLRQREADALVLGCTHFLFLAGEFRVAAGEDIRVYDSVGGVSRRIGALLDEGDLRSLNGRSLNGRSENASSAAKLLVLTGEEPPGDDWLERAASFGMEPHLLGEFLPREELPEELPREELP